MARLLTTGWELNETLGLAAAADGISDPNRGTSTTVMSIVTSPVRSGTYSGQLARGSGDADVATWAVGASAIALSTSYFSRFYFQLTALPATASLVVGQFGTNIPAVSVRLTTAGTLQLWDEVNVVQIGSASAATIATGTWYRVELGFVTNASTQMSSATLFLDGTQVATGSTTLGGSFSGTIFLRMGCCATLASGNALTMNLDDAAINDSTGAAQNTWPGEGKVVLLTPASDNAKGTGWTNDAAGASNFFDAVNNTPPVGIADTAGSTGLHQIRNATSNANSNYDANLATYAAAGLGVSDAVNVLVPIVATAAPVTTSAKAGTVGVSANPVIANVSLGAGGTAGAFWSGSAGGTYPTGWKWSKGTTTYAPAVTVASAPVMRITQVTSSTRIAVVCAMGMYVDYTPAPPPDLGLGLTVT